MPLKIEFILLKRPVLVNEERKERETKNYEKDAYSIFIAK
tara:strand:- start:222 stop:341 length:120 start_codon:yes stop_codon:yes gene_type:complete